MRHLTRPAPRGGPAPAPHPTCRSVTSRQPSTSLPAQCSARRQGMIRRAADAVPARPVQAQIQLRGDRTFGGQANVDGATRACNGLGVARRIEATGLDGGQRVPAKATSLRRRVGTAARPRGSPTQSPAASTGLAGCKSSTCLSAGLAKRSDRSTAHTGSAQRVGSRSSAFAASSPDAPPASASISWLTQAAVATATTSEPARQASAKDDLRRGARRRGADGGWRSGRHGCSREARNGPDTRPAETQRAGARHRSARFFIWSLLRSSSASVD